MSDDDREQDRPSTRRMDPIDPSAGTGAYPETGALPETGAYPGPGAYPGSGAHAAPGTYGEPGAYAAAPGTGQLGQGQGQGQATGYPGGEPPSGPPKSNTGRTVLLSLIALLALAILILAGFLVFRSVGSSDSGGGVVAESSSTTTSTVEETESSTTTSTTSSPTSTRTRPTAGPGEVTYQFTGRGSLVAVRYTTAGGDQVLATAGAPWSVHTSVGDSGSAELTGIVVNGPVTCTIMHGEEQLASSTSNGGPLTCRATVPN